MDCDIISTEGMSREDWLAERRKGIGGSDAAAVCGLSEYQSPLEVYLDKVGEAEPQPESEAMAWGNLLEPVIAAEWQERARRPVSYPKVALVSRSIPWLRCQPDGLVGPSSAPNGILEVKTVGARSADQFGEEGSDSIPEPYIAQAQHMMAVTGLPVVHFAVLVAGQSLRQYEVPRDEDLIQALIGLESGFWKLVEARTPPNPQTLKDIALRWPVDIGTVKPATAETLDRIGALREAKKQQALVKAQIEGLEAAIKLEMGDAAVLTDGIEPAVTWKGFISKRLDTKRFKAERPDMYAEYATETSSRRFLLKGI